MHPIRHIHQLRELMRNRVGDAELDESEDSEDLDEIRNEATRPLDEVLGGFGLDGDLEAADE